MDSTVSETYGKQEGSAYSGYFACECCHFLFCFNQFGDVERALLRNGKVHSADDWHAVLEAEVYLYAIHLPSNEVLQRQIEPLLTRPVGRPANEPVVCYADSMCQADSWDKPRRQRPLPDPMRQGQRPRALLLSGAARSHRCRGLSVFVLRRRVLRGSGSLGCELPLHLGGE